MQQESLAERGLTEIFTLNASSIPYHLECWQLRFTCKQNYSPMPKFHRLQQYLKVEFILNF